MIRKRRRKISRTRYSQKPNFQRNFLIPDHLLAFSHGIFFASIVSQISDHGVYVLKRKKTKTKRNRRREKNDATIASCAARLFCWDPNRRTRVAIQFQRLLLSPERPPRQKQPRVWHTWFTCELVTASGGSVYVDKTRMYTHGTASSRPLVAFVRGREGVSRCRMFWRGSWRNCKEKTEGKKRSLRFFAFLSLTRSPSLYPSLSDPVFRSCGYMWPVWCSGMMNSCTVLKIASWNMHQRLVFK